MSQKRGTSAIRLPAVRVFKAYEQGADVGQSALLVLFPRDSFGYQRVVSMCRICGQQAMQQHLVHGTNAYSRMRESSFLEPHM